MTPEFEGEGRAGPGSPRRLSGLALVVAISSAALIAIGLFGVWYPYTLEPYEGTVLQPAQRLASGSSIYGPEVLLAPPHLWAAYGPVFYMVCGLLMKAGGSVFWPGRLISLLASVGTGALLGAVVRRHGSDAAALAALAIFFVLPTTWSFGTLCRVDALAVFLAAVAVALFLTAGGRNGRLFFAGCSSCLAFFTKPTVVAATGAIVVLLAARGRWRGLGSFLAGGATVLVLMAGLLHSTANDGYWLSQLFNSRVPFSPSTGIRIFRAFAQNYVVLAAAVLWATGFALAGRKRWDMADSFAATFLAASGLLAALTSTKAGASINYYCEVGVALALSAGLAFARVTTARPSHNGAPDLPSWMLTIAVAGQLFVYNASYVEGRVLKPLRWTAVYHKAIEEIERHVPTTGTVGGEYPEIALMAGRQVWMNDWAMFALGPAEVQKVRESSITERKVDAWVMAGASAFPGYVQLDLGSVDLSSNSGNLHRPGPLVFLREESARPEAPR